MKRHKNSLKRLSPSLVIATLAVTTSIGLANRVEWPLSLGGNGHEYEVVLTPSGMNWSDARAAAEAAGGHLATVANMDELDFINSLDFAGTSKGWIGGYQDTTASDYEEPDGGWRWVTGEPWSFIGWWEGAPSSSPTRNFVQLAYTQCQDEIDVDNEGEWYVIEYDNSAAMQWSTNGHWYQAVEVEPYLNWEEASDLATAQGGHLATPVTEEEDLWIINTLLTDDSLWGYNGYYAFGPHIGGWQNFDSPDYSEPGGGWEWITGELLEYTNWLGLDNCCGGQSRMQYYTEQIDGSWKVGWADVAVVNNEVLQRSYLVEWSADCNGDGIVDYGQILDGSLEDLDGNGIPDCCDDGSCATVTVAQDGTGDYTTIQEAINAAGDGTEIVVYPGTYTGLPGATNIIETAGKAVEIRSSGGPEVTILDAGNNWGLRGMRCDSGETAATVLEGFTITGGNEIKGGGIFCDNNSNPTIINCVITQNTVTDQGGGVYFASCSPTLVDCTISNNFCGNHGGGFFCYDSNTTITNCTISGNMADVHDGGGIYFSSGTPNLTGCTISGNSANDDGGGLFCDETNANITDCEIMGNSASQGAGVYCYTNAAPIITNCTISGNTASNNGGGIYSNGSNPALADTTLCGNAPDQILGNWTDHGGNSIDDTCSCPSDVDNNGVVNVNDVLVVLAEYGTSNPLGDANGDGIVDVNDLLQVIGDWGMDCG